MVCSNDGFIIIFFNETFQKTLRSLFSFIYCPPAIGEVNGLLFTGWAEENNEKPPLNILC